MIKEAIRKIVCGRDLNYPEAGAIMKELMSGKATNAQIASLLTSLRMKGESVEEISAFAKVMRDYCFQIHPDVNRRIVDIVGTGGDRIKSFNISTTSAFVVAGIGITVAKHGNRSFTSKCGSADVLEKLGYDLNTDPGLVEKAVEKIGVGFMFAPRFHPAMKYASEPRKEIGIRTVFNILGPITNPANAKGFLLGVYERSLTGTIASVLKNLGSEEAMVVHGLDGLDEISTIGRTEIVRLKDGEITIMDFSPKQFGIRLAKPEEISGFSPDENAEIVFKIINGYYTDRDPKLDIVLINSAAGIIVGGLVDKFDEALELANESIKSGATYTKLKEMIKFCNGDMEKLEGLETKYG
ncbi:MAG: anthranilate phosphoribosyltransferase [Candidatus Methylarchaceae archaeon HK02M2]|nr:anthranilate phosphoribosyltransferase [Candidatus Methylarchaceae archaeon HK02M2]